MTSPRGELSGPAVGHDEVDLRAVTVPEVVQINGALAPADLLAHVVQHERLEERAGDPAIGTTQINLVDKMPHT